ncbi:glycoside hydrolase family 25 protein [Lewinella sp. 4G2]|uniref:glycoside hydrolase family 25 protein n=1 Tax=Lewinella sp. 4G2 TaxID=1803372 RepID=UPI0007B475AE|nr:GH25 family lysozyme [Lewinella sp. 4G2]
MSACDWLLPHDAKNYGVVGIDVSHHQGLIRWDRVGTTGYDFVFMKATEGRSLRDKAFLYNWTEAGKQDLRRGAYHFFLPYVPAIEQANNFMATVDLQPGDFPPVLDVEKAGQLSPDRLVEMIQEWSAATEERYGVKPIIYSGQNFYNRYLSGQLKDHHFWLARYARKKPVTVDNHAYAFWQFTDRGKTRGINGRIDKNVFTGSAETWQELVIPNETEPTPREPNISVSSLLAL